MTRVTDGKGRVNWRHCTNKSRFVKLEGCFGEGWRGVVRRGNRFCFTSPVYLLRPSGTVQLIK
jgi:hypothetical protein